MTQLLLNNLFIAIIILKYTVSMFACYIFQKNETPLHWSINIEVAEILIQHGADVYSRDNNVSMYDVKM